MISLRQHAVSIAAIFLALAIGVLLGSQTLAADLLSGLRSDRTDLQRRVDQLTEHNDQLGAQLTAADRFIEQTSSRILGGTLSDRSVVVFTTADADADDVAAVAHALEVSGATLAGRITLTDAFSDAAEGDRVRTAITNVLPAGARLATSAVDQGSLAGDLLGQVLLLDPINGRTRSTPQELGLVLETLRAGGFLVVGGLVDGDLVDGGQTVHPAQFAVVVTGNGADADTDVGVDADFMGSTIAHFTGALSSHGSGVVLAGRPGAAQGSGPIAVVRADDALAARIAIVDNVERDIGRVRTVLALGE
ncbi:copper transporter, partial [Nocardia sp. CNY236]|uniref:copper transporter n=1 Tax=Nocardia sp. CNY236 TaxID=1169152 RepID=UPI000414DCCB